MRRRVLGTELYAADLAESAPDAACLGCGVPTAVADLHPGEVVLDLGAGAGAGADVLISAGIPDHFDSSERSRHMVSTALASSRPSITAAAAGSHCVPSHGPRSRSPA